MFPRYLVIFLSAWLSAALLAATAPAFADNVGARIYTQALWRPQNPTQDHVETPYDNQTIVSDALNKAWNAVKLPLQAATMQMLNNYNIGNGFTISGVITKINNISAIKLYPHLENGAQLQFLVPATTVSVALSSKAVQDADKFTAGLASDLLTPAFAISFDMVMEVQLMLTDDPNQIIRCTTVHAIVENVQVKPTNDAAKALSAVNDLVSFFGGPDFLQMMQRKLDSTDLANGSVADQINRGLTALNQPYQLASQSGLFVPKRLWADYSRLTIYMPPPPITNIPTDGQVTGFLFWDPNIFPTANCSNFDVIGKVQVAPRPLAASDGEHYGDPPMVQVGRYSAHASSGGLQRLSIPGKCTYLLSAVPLNWVIEPSATSNAAPATSFGTNNPLVGSVHTVDIMLPVDWSGDSAVVSAANINFQLSKGLAGGPGVGNPHPVAPGLANQSWPEDGVDPAQYAGQSTTNPSQGESSGSIDGGARLRQGGYYGGESSAQTGGNQGGYYGRRSSWTNNDQGSSYNNASRNPSFVNPQVIPNLMNIFRRPNQENQGNQNTQQTRFPWTHNPSPQ